VQQGPSLFLAVLIVAGIAQPAVSGFVRAAGTDPAPALQFWLAATLCGLGAVLQYPDPANRNIVMFAGLFVALLYLALGLIQLFRRSKIQRGPDHAFRRAEAAATQSRRARGLMVWGAGIALAAPLWYLVSFAAGRWIALQDPPAPITIAGIVAGALFVASGYFLGPLLREHREELRGLHKQETGLRQSYHRLLVKKLEGART